MILDFHKAQGMSAGALFCACFFTGLCVCTAQSGKAELKFTSTTYKFGKIDRGETVKFSFPFENTGSAPLIIDEIKVTCGCTVVGWPKHPIGIGEKDTLQVEFNTAKKYGWQDRTIEVYSNAKTSPYVLRFKGMVKNPEEKRN